MGFHHLLRIDQYQWGLIDKALLAAWPVMGIVFHPVWVADGGRGIWLQGTKSRWQGQSLQFHSCLSVPLTGLLEVSSADKSGSAVHCGSPLHSSITIIAHSIMSKGEFLNGTVDRKKKKTDQTVTSVNLLKIRILKY